MNSPSIATSSISNSVGVGIMITHDPLHGSGRAVFPHPALALGDDAHAAQGIRMTDAYGRGSQRVISRRIRSQRTRPFWLRRDSARCQSWPTWNRKMCQRRERSWARHSSGSAHRTTERSHLPHFRDGIVHTPLEAQFSLRSASLATACASSAAAP